jgi:hypothetical protein
MDSRERLSVMYVNCEAYDDGVWGCADGSRKVEKRT